VQHKIALFLLFVTALLWGDLKKNHYDKPRQDMVKVIQREVESTRGYLGREKLKKSVIDAMKSVERHSFVPPK